jgi:glycosyltransferase
MKISIITICYNNEKDIIRTIESVINQTHPDIEYIIVDGGSKDSTMKIVEKYKTHISKIISEPDHGIYDAINKGIKTATGDIIGLIHAGDYLYNNEVIRKINDHFENNPEDEAIYGHAIVINSKEKIVRIDKSPLFSKSLFKRGWFLPHESFYAKRYLFKKYGLYNLKYKIAADYELILRFLYFNNVKVNLLNDYIFYFSIGGTSSKNIRNIIKQNIECVDAWRFNGKCIPFYTIPLKIIRKLPLFLNGFFHRTNENYSQ